MTNKCFFPIDYPVNFFDAEGPTGDLLEDALKYAMLIYDKVVIDITNDCKDAFVNWILPEQDLSCKKEVLKSLESIDCLDIPKIDLSTRSNDVNAFIAATYETIYDVEPVWENHWPVALIRAKEMAMLIIGYLHICEEGNIEFYTSDWQFELLGKLLDNFKTGIHKGSAVAKLIQSYKGSKFKRLIKGSKFRKLMSKLPNSDLMDRDPAEEIITYYDQPIGYFEKTLSENYRKMNTNFNSTQFPQLPSIGKFLELYLPESNKLTWLDIVTLRNSSFREEFKDVIFSNDTTIPRVKKNANEYLIEELYKVLRRNKPSKYGGVLMRGIANIPVPIIGINPVAIVNDIKGGFNEAKDFRLFGWLYFLAEAHGLSNKSTV